MILMRETTDDPDESRQNHDDLQTAPIMRNSYESRLLSSRCDVPTRASDRICQDRIAIFITGRGAPIAASSSFGSSICRLRAYQLLDQPISSHGADVSETAASWRVDEERRTSRLVASSRAGLLLIGGSPSRGWAVSRRLDPAVAVLATAPSREGSASVSVDSPGERSVIVRPLLDDSAISLHDSSRRR